ncbi:fungal-specific transcription factor domain-containing protein [Russula earlei]|uniref:Fungal-specific transcription factor domain-containing protein n=1 Tax=Russula earlei TaxID=71964 RepID=A0ACC0U978_9AGAM|nr:fungal-specific transcription factor domain-containing protein [Russula earlei]
MFSSFSPLVPLTPPLMSSHNAHNAHLVIKSESPPLLSVPISTGHPHSHYVDGHPQFRFGAGEQSVPPTFSFMPHPRSSSSPWPQHTPVNSYPDTLPASQSHFGLPSVDDPNVLTLTDEYDDGDEIADLPSVSGSAVDLFPDSSVSSSKALNKAVRRRSSKACDQCRKSKCKCERTSENEPCKACIMLGTHCTFLGPSRKRGPPKGYIDAIEARLHQTEALVGIMLAINDSRATSLLDDLSQDPLAYEIIKRVDNSPYGVKGRARAAEASSASSKLRPHPAGVKTKSESPNSSFHTTHPSTEWQEHLIDHLTSLALVRGQSSQSPSCVSPQPSHTGRPTLSLSIGRPRSSDSSEPPRSRQRRVYSRSPSDSFYSLRSSPAGPGTSSAVLGSDPMDEHEKNRGIEEDALVSEVGHLSLNEEREVRFHGQASGLHLLDVKERVDGRSEGGIWHFPKARVWPPLPESDHNPRPHGEEDSVTLPDAATQEELLDLYFAYVHPALPVLHKKSFLEKLRNGHVARQSRNTPDSPSPLQFGRRRPHASPLLLLAMFSVAARYTSAHDNDRLPSESTMWPAGDVYLEQAKRLLDSSYSSSRPATCQALLLMGYREIGIGAMAQAWLYVGMAIRMAQDLGIHKSADQWMHGGSSLFTSVELQERRRIWYACVIIDKYVSSYMGRPLSIYERDFDTELPNIDESEEMEEWQPAKRDREVYNCSPFPIYPLSCFNASAALSNILSEVVQTIYAVRPGLGRHSESIRLGGLLDKWLLELPEHLRFGPSNRKKQHPMSPFVLTLHMQYWCVVLLLHRPFMRYADEIRTQGLHDSSDPELRVISQKNHDLCVQAANRITSIVTTFKERLSVRRAPVFLSYYVFTASIMHVQILNAYPGDPQARNGLTTCMDVLQRMSIAWPSAGRAWELLHGSKANLQNSVVSLSTIHVVRSQKRTADHFLDDEASLYQVELHSTTQGERSGALHGQPHPEQGTALGASQNFYPLCDRWPEEGSLNDFAGSLSTSVLPQQYSTGFFDRAVRGTNTSSLAEVGISPQQDSHVGRRGITRYWNDYAALSELDAPFTSSVEHESEHHQQPHSQTYPISGQYSLYDNLPPPHV